MKGRTNGILLSDMSHVKQDSQGYLCPESKKNKMGSSQSNMQPTEDEVKFSVYLIPNSGGNGVNLGIDQKCSIGQESRSYLHPVTKGIPGHLSSPDSGNGEGQISQKQFDSGVADLDQVGPQLFMETGSKFRPLSKHGYDYADYAGHQYEELPHSPDNRVKYHDKKFMEAGDSRSEHQSSGGTTLTDLQSDIDDSVSIARTNEKRKRVNPLYDSVNQSTPSIYTKSRSGKDVILQKQINCLKIIIGLLIFLLLVTLAASLYTFVVQYQEQKKMEEKVDTLQEKYSTLHNKFVSMEQLLGMNDTSELFAALMDRITGLENLSDTHYMALESQIEAASTSIVENTDSILHVFSNMTEQMSNLNSTMQEEIDTIIKMPGPQGPQGIGNLSACFYKKITHSKKVSSQTPPSTTRWYPYVTHSTSSMTLQNYVPMFVSCSVTGGTFQQMELNLITENMVQYRCYCTGYVDGNIDRYCYMHLWLCPRITDPLNNN